MPAVTVGYHWFTYSTQREAGQVLDIMGGGFGERERIGGFGHPVSIAHESGARVYYGSELAQQPVVVNVPGEVCETWSEEAAGWLRQLDGSLTRFDVALDLDPPELARRRLIELERAWRRGKVETRIRRSSHSLVKSDGPGEGWTSYYGGKSSALRLRVYDRRGPLRLEFQVRPEGARRVFARSVLEKFSTAAVWRCFAHQVRFRLPWYEELLDGDAASWCENRREVPEFLQVIEQLQAQYGSTIHSLKLVGFDLGDLAVRPKELRRDLRAKLLRLAKGATAAGYDGEALEREVKSYGTSCSQNGTQAASGEAGGGQGQVAVDGAHDEHRPARKREPEHCPADGAAVA